MISFIEIKDLFIKTIKSGWDKLQRIGFWIFIILLIGVYVGIIYEKKYLYNRIDEAVILGCFLNEKDGKVYNVIVDPSRSGKK
jgi:hypothetical protein